MLLSPSAKKAHSHTFFGFDSRTEKGKEVIKERKSLKREVKIFTMRQQRVIKTEVCLLEKLGTRNPTICGQINSSLSLGIFVRTCSDRNLKGYRSLSCVSPGHLSQDGQSQYATVKGECGRI